MRVFRRARKLFENMAFQSALLVPLGVLAFLQVAFLPGFLIHRTLRIPGSFAEKTLGIFALSLMANYLAVFALTAVGIYILPVVLTLVAGELAAAVFLCRHSLGSWLMRPLEKLFSDAGVTVRKGIGDTAAWFEEEMSCPERRAVVAFIFILAAATFLYVAYVFVSNIGTIFNLWDPIVSWNRWAVEWSRNALPFNTWEYPQLIPANWSVFYVILGTPIQYFAKAIQPLFLLGIVVAFSVVALQRKSIGYLAAVPVTVFLMRILNGVGIMATEGYVDTAVAFFGLLSILSLLDVFPSEDRALMRRRVLMGALFACGAAMTKQAGLYVALIYPLLAYFMVVKDHERGKQLIRYIALYAGLLVLLVGPFYAYKEFSFASHSDISVMPSILYQVYGSGISPLAQMVAGFASLFSKSYGLVLIYAIFGVFAWRDRRLRQVTAFVIIPFTFIWSFVFSYDTRNLSLAMPFVGLAAGIGLEQALRSRIGERLGARLSSLKLIWVAAAILATIIAVSPIISAKMLSGHFSDQREMYDQELSLILCNYFEHHPEGMIYTDFPILYFLSATENRIYSPYGGYSTEHNDFDAFFSHATDTPVAYIFAADYTAPDVKIYIAQQVASGGWSEVFRYHDSVLVKTDTKI